MSKTAAKIIDISYAVSHPVRSGATFWQKIFLILRFYSGAFLSKCHLPGFIKNCEVSDKVTGDFIQVRTGSLFTVISVNGRDYHFSRLTGQFAGTGSALVN